MLNWILFVENRRRLLNMRTLVVVDSSIILKSCCEEEGEWNAHNYKCCDKGYVHRLYPLPFRHGEWSASRVENAIRSALLTCFFSSRDLRRNLRIWRRVRMISDDVIFTSKSAIMSGSHILDRQGPIISFRHNLKPKKYFFSKVWLVSDSARSDLFKEPIKS